MADLNTKLAILLRGLQWSCDDIAFRLPTGKVTKAELTLFADQPSTVADIARAHAAGTDAPNEVTP